MSALATSQTETGASTGSTTLTTNTEAIIAAATSAEAAAAVAQEQGATLVTVHPAVIETPVDGAEGGNEGEENEGDGKLRFALHYLSCQSYCMVIVIFFYHEGFEFWNYCTWYIHGWMFHHDEYSMHYMVL